MNRWGEWLVAASITIAAISLYLWWNARESYKTQLQAIERVLAPASGRLLRVVGYHEGHFQELKWTENRRTLVIYLSPTCRHCESNMGLWTQLVRHAREKGAGVFLVCLEDSLEDAYIQRLGVGRSELFLGIDGTAEATLRLDVVPQTLVLSPEGAVIEAKVGVLDAGDVRRLGERIAGQ